MVPEPADNQQWIFRRIDQVAAQGLFVHGRGKRAQLRVKGFLACIDAEDVRAVVYARHPLMTAEDLKPLDLPDDNRSSAMCRPVLTYGARVMEGLLRRGDKANVDKANAIARMLSRYFTCAAWLCEGFVLALRSKGKLDIPDMPRATPKAIIEWCKDSAAAESKTPPPTPYELRMMDLLMGHALVDVALLALRRAHC